MSKTIRTTCGVALLAAGVIGTLLPIIPGIPLFIAGAALLGPEHPLVRPFADWLKRRRQSHPRPAESAAPGPPPPR